MLGNILLGIVAVCDMTSYLPQIIKIVKTKSAEDISATSWIIWIISYIAYTLYATLVSKDKMLILITFLGLIFCLIILILTLKYQKKK